jgi:dynein heavy chain
LPKPLQNNPQVIFQHYAKDLEAVQATYEAHKHKPPLPRNAPPIAGNIIWARQLLRRIEAPMQRFAYNRALVGSKESRRVIRLYNRVAKALVEFEALWHAAWLKVGLDVWTWQGHSRGLVQKHVPQRSCVCAHRCTRFARAQGIDAQKAGLSAPLLTRNSETGQLLVNLDRDVMALIR